MGQLRPLFHAVELRFDLKLTQLCLIPSFLLSQGEEVFIMHEEGSQEEVTIMTRFG